MRVTKMARTRSEIIIGTMKVGEIFTKCAGKKINVARTCLETGCRI